MSNNKHESDNTIELNSLEFANNSDKSVTLDGDNTYPDCKCCGRCCQLNVLAIKPGEAKIMHEYIDAHSITPVDYHGECCPLRSLEGKCMIWEARPQVCRLHNCHVPRKVILEQNPDLEIDTGFSLLDLHVEFVEGKHGYASVRNQMFGLG